MPIKIWHGLIRCKWWLVVGGLLGLGLAIRLYDITDAPLEFHPVRQLRSAIIARAIYYRLLPGADPALRQIATDARNTLEIFEPPTQEALAALGYLVTGGENLWIGRLLSTLFWLMGGLALFDLARRMVSLFGAIISLAYYLVLPFAIAVSRSFQPDALMVMGVILTVWAFERWLEKLSWRWAVCAGLLAGATIFIKGTALYPLAPALGFGTLSVLGRRAFRNPQVWTMAALALIVPVIYYGVLTGRSASMHVSYWLGAFTEFWISPRFYVFWLKMLANLVGLALLCLGLLGVALFSKAFHRWLLLGWWLGYLFFGLTFPYQIYTHEYYSLMLVPLLGVCLAPLADVAVKQIGPQPKGWRLLVAFALFVALAYPSWITFTGLKGRDDRPEVLGWQKMGREMPKDGPIVGLTHDYGFRLMYYGWTITTYWPASIDLQVYTERGANSAAVDDFERFFDEKTAGAGYFLVTLPADLAAQPALYDKLYKQYPYVEGEGYVLFDLRNPLP